MLRVTIRINKSLKLGTVERLMFARDSTSNFNYFQVTPLFTLIRTSPTENFSVIQLSSLVVKINLFKILFFLSSHHDGNRSSVGWSKRRPPLTRKRDRVIVSRKTFRLKSRVLVTFSTATTTRIMSRNWTLLEENRSCAVTFVSPLNDWKLDAPMRCELIPPINRRLLLLKNP
jgi:hypothetical protein